MVTDDDTLMHLRPKDTFEKLLWERQMNKLLSKELREKSQKVGELESTIEEMKHEFKLSEKGRITLKYREMKATNLAKDLKLRDYRKEVDDLMSRLAKANEALLKAQANNNPCENCGCCSPTDFEEELLP